ncbi:hypothetical protein ABW19_dt0208316 [Dactylella cylindrospora]|nr:hypothetical protein ABW19_dt0208316 [Dactylella cylindrospora]
MQSLTFLLALLLASSLSYGAAVPDNNETFIQDCHRTCAMLAIGNADVYYDGDDLKYCDNPKIRERFEGCVKSKDDCEWFNDESTMGDILSVTCSRILKLVDGLVSPKTVTIDDSIEPTTNCHQTRSSQSFSADGMVAALVILSAVILIGAVFLHGRWWKKRGRESQKGSRAYASSQTASNSPFQELPSIERRQEPALRDNIQGPAFQEFGSQGHPQGAPPRELDSTI